jgi:hypothetical protein
MFVSVSRNGQPLASIALVSSDPSRSASLLASFISQGGCQFTVKRRQSGGRCVDEELGSDELKYQMRLLYQASQPRRKFTKVYVGPDPNPLRSRGGYVRVSR